MALSLFQAWLTWSVVALAYALVFLQRIALSTVVDRLMVDLKVGAPDIGLMTAAYFYGYMVMQLPAGLLVDRWGPRRVVLTSSGLSAVGTLWFAQAATATGGAAARGLVGFADALVFSALIKVATQWFSPSRFGLMAGLSQVSGYLGGLCATTPLALSVARIGWRGSFRVLAYAIGATFVLSWLCLRDHPSTATSPTRPLGDSVRDLGRSCRHLTTWGPIVTYVGNYVSSMALSGVWGFPLLMQAYGLSRAEASVSMFGFMLSYAAGTVVIGYLSDAYFQTLRKPIILTAAARIVLLLLLAPYGGAQLSRTALSSCLAALGFCTGGMIPLTLASLRRAVGPEQIATGVGLLGTTANMASGLAQPLCGLVLELHWAGGMAEGARLYTPEGYTWLVVLLASVSFGSIIGPLFTLDNRPRSP